MQRDMRSRFHLRLLAALAVVMGLAACTIGPAATRGPQTPFPTNAVVRLRDAIPATLAQGSADFEFDAIITGSKTIRYGTAYGGSGSSTLGEPRQMKMTADFGALGLGQIEVIVDGARTYLTGGFLDPLLDTGEWVVIDEASDDPEVVELVDATGRASDISIVLYYLYGESGPVVQRPPQTLRGLPAARYALTLDLDRAADEAPVEVRDSLAGYIDTLRETGIERTLDAEVWIQDDGLIHRIILAYSIEPLKGGGTMRVTYDFVDFGDPVELVTPAPKKVVPLEKLLR